MNAEPPTGRRRSRSSMALLSENAAADQALDPRPGRRRPRHARARLAGTAKAPGSYSSSFSSGGRAAAPSSSGSSSGSSHGLLVLLLALAVWSGAHAFRPPLAPLAPPSVNRPGGRLLPRPLHAAGAGDGPSPPPPPASSSSSPSSGSSFQPLTGAASGVPLAFSSAPPAPPAPRRPPPSPSSSREEETGGSSSSSKGARVVGGWMLGGQAQPPPQQQSQQQASGPLPLPQMPPIPPQQEGEDALLLHLRPPPPPAIGPMTKEEAVLEELEAAKAAQEAAEVVASFVEAATQTDPLPPEPQPQQQQQQQQEQGGNPLGWLWSAVTAPFTPKPEQQQQPQPQPQPPLPSAAVSAPPVQIVEGDDDDIGTPDPAAVVAAELVSSLAQPQEQRDGDGGKGPWGAVDALWGAALGGVQGLFGGGRPQEEQERAVLLIADGTEEAGGALAPRASSRLALEGERVSRGVRVLDPSSSGAQQAAGSGAAGGVELFERREATATLGKGPKKWSLQVALDVSLRFLLRRNHIDADADAEAALPDETSATVLTPTRARELEERGWAVRGEEPPPPVLQRLREREAELGVVRLDTEEEVEEEAKMGGVLGWVSAVADGAWGIATGRWLWGGRNDEKDAAKKQQQQQQSQQQLALAAAPPRAPSRGASVGGKVTEGVGLHGVGGVGGSLIPHVEGEPWGAKASAPAATTTKGAPSLPGKQQPPATSQKKPQQPSGPPKKQPPPATAAAAAKAPPKPRAAIPLSPTAAVAVSEHLATDEADTSAASSEPRDRKRDRFRRFLGGLLPSGRGGQGSGSRARTRGALARGRRSELARNLGLTEAETMGANTARAFGGIGLAPGLEGPLLLRPLGKRERARIYLQRVGGRPLLWTLLRYSPLAALEEEHDEANEHLSALRAASRKRRKRRGALGRLRRAGAFVLRNTPYVRWVPSLEPYFRSLAPALAARLLGTDAAAAAAAAEGEGGAPSPEEGALPVYTPTAISQYRMVKERDAIFPPFILAAAGRAEKVRVALAQLLSPQQEQQEDEEEAGEDGGVAASSSMDAGAVVAQQQQQQQGQQGQDEEGNNPWGWAVRGAQGAVSWVGSLFGAGNPDPAASAPLPPPLVLQAPQAAIDGAMPIPAAAAAATAAADSASSASASSSWSWGLFSFFFPSTAPAAASLEGTAVPSAGATAAAPEEQAGGHDAAAVKQQQQSPSPPPPPRPEEPPQPQQQQQQQRKGWRRQRKGSDVPGAGEDAAAALRLIPPLAFDAQEQGWYMLNSQPPPTPMQQPVQAPPGAGPAAATDAAAAAAAVATSPEPSLISGSLPPSSAVAAVAGAGSLASLERGMASAAVALLANAQTRRQFVVMVKEAGGLQLLLRGLVSVDPAPSPFRGQALETLCRLLGRQRRRRGAVGGSGSGGAEEAGGNGAGGDGVGPNGEDALIMEALSLLQGEEDGEGDVEGGGDDGGVGSLGTGALLPPGEEDEDPPGGEVMRLLTADAETEAAVLRTLLALVEAPLALSVARVAGLRNPTGWVKEELRCQRAAVHLLYLMCLASDRAVEWLQTEGWARLVPALKQMLRERVFDERSPSVYQTIHKLLTAVGFHEWAPRQPGQKGLRILSLDGGGTRGVMTVALLKHLVEATGKEVHDLFDIVCGTSTGGILAALFGVKRTRVQEAGRLYDELIKKIFAKAPAALAYSNLVLRTAQYNENVWEDILKVLIGETLLIDSMGGPQGLRTPKFFVLSSVLSSNPAKLFMWRNYNYRSRAQRSRYEGDFRARVREAIRATTAAPTYFYPLVRRGMVHSDGALLANNPTAIAIHEAKILYPNVPIEAVVSFGTGNPLEAQPVEGFGWAPIFNQLINSATNTEAVHDSLADFLPSDRYFRFNPAIENLSIDEVRPEKLAYLKLKAKEFFAEPRNKERLDQLVRLLQPHGPGAGAGAGAAGSGSGLRGTGTGNKGAKGGPPATGAGAVTAGTRLAQQQQQQPPPPPPPPPLQSPPRTATV